VLEHRYNRAALAAMSWPHAPHRRQEHEGALMITASTLHKAKLFDTDEKLRLLQTKLFELCLEHEWRLQAWAIFANHYHIIAILPEKPNVPEFEKLLHGRTSFELNRLDGTRGRQVWFNYFDKALSESRSYLPRLKYVHQNPVHHGIVKVASDYPFCSAAWFEREAAPAYQRLVESFPIDKLRVPDDF
jgi:putative transposase